MPLNTLRIVGAHKDTVLTGPRSLYIDLTTACNIQCNFCWIHSPLVKRYPLKKNLILDFPTIKHVIDTARVWGTEEILLSGDGEPTMHPAITNIISYTKKNNLYLFMATNATFNVSFLKQMARVDYLYVDLCSPDEETYARLQAPGKRKLFRNVIRNLKVACGLYKKFKKPYVNVAFIINKTNYEQIPKMLALLEQLEVNEVTFRIMESTTETDALLLTKKDREKLIAIITKTLRQRFYLRHNLKEVHAGLTDYRHSPFSFKRCYTGWFSVLVDVTKNVGICCHNEHLVIGNLKNHSLKEIWESKRAQRMRLKCKYAFDLKKYPFKGECLWCHWHTENNRVIEEIKKLTNAKKV